MYKIMIADDEGIVIDALKFIIEEVLGKSCVIESAKTGRQVIELAERFRPDIAFMDIHMPGLSGIRAMKEIRKTNQSMIFIVISAYEKFDYAKEAISLSVMEYLNKPIVKDKVEQVLSQAIALVDENQKKRENELRIQEKLETVLPIIENGMIYSILFQDDFDKERENYRVLLGLNQCDGYIMIIRFGDSYGEGLTNLIGSSIKAHPFYHDLRDTIKEYTHGIVGAIMGNSIITYVPANMSQNEYEQRIQVIDKMRDMIRRLRKKIEIDFRVGIGSIHHWSEIYESYQEAMEAIRAGHEKVTHVTDLSIGCQYENDYPAQIEKRVFQAVENGDHNTAVEAAGAFFDWMTQTAPTHQDDIKLKTLEIALWCEKLAYQSSGMVYRFLSRQTYLTEVVSEQDMKRLRHWFLDKIGQSSDNVRMKKKESAHDVIDQAKKYIEEHYHDASLDRISREVNISPYYFSKLFKEKTGSNFVEYMTEVKILKAKNMIAENQKSMKEICLDIGYANPNYFSYIFKKKVGITPSEYREGLQL